MGADIEIESRPAASVLDTADEIVEGKIRTLMDWLQEQTNRVLLIRKREEEDLDRVRMQLDEVGYRQGDRSIDGYTGGPSLVLNGRGTIMTDTTEAPLPRDSYVIPLARFEVARTDGGGIELRTDRANYRISPDNAERL